MTPVPGHAACPSCGSTSSREVLSDESTLQILHCAECHVRYLAGWEAQLARFTEHYDYHRPPPGVALVDTYSELNTARQRELLARWRRRVSGTRLLDVGCGRGQLIHTARAEGWEAEGIDLAPSAVEACQAAGLPVRGVDFFSEEVETAGYDVIVLSELLEHVPQPGKFLARAEELLRPGGLVYLTTPNFGALSRRVLGSGWRAIHPQHIVYLDRRSILELVERHSQLSVEEVRTLNVSVGALWTKRRRREGAANGSPVPSRDLQAAEAWGVDQRLRRLTGGVSGKVLKSLVNVAVDRTSLGESLVATLRRPGGVAKSRGKKARVNSWARARIQPDRSRLDV